MDGHGWARSGGLACAKEYVQDCIYTFLSLPYCALDIFVTGKRINRGGGYGLEIPANFYFYGPEEAISWFKNKINIIEEKLKDYVKDCLK